jgi:hypothetical protein
MKNFTVGTEFFHADGRTTDGRTDRQTDRHEEVEGVDSRFSQFFEGS